MEYHLKNMLVVIICVAEYDIYNKKPHDLDLPGATKDLINLVSLFENGYNYKVLPTKGARVTLNDILLLLDEARMEFKKNEYDGVIVYFSGHGTEKSLLSSEYDGRHGAILRKDFCQWVDGDHCSSRVDKYKFYFLDACRGSQVSLPVGTRTRGFIAGRDREPVASSPLRVASENTCYMYGNANWKATIDDGDRGGLLTAAVVQAFRSNLQKIVAIGYIMEEISKIAKESGDKDGMVLPAIETTIYTPMACITFGPKNVNVVYQNETKQQEIESDHIQIRELNVADNEQDDVSAKVEFIGNEYPWIKQQLHKTDEDIRRILSKWSNDMIRVTHYLNELYTTYIDNKNIDKERKKQRINKAVNVCNADYTRIAPMKSSKQKPSTSVIGNNDTAAFLKEIIPVSSLTIHPASDEVKDYDKGENLAGIVLYAKDGKTDWEWNGVHCKTGDIIIKKTDEKFMSLKAGKGIVHGRVFKSVFDECPFGNVVASGFGRVDRGKDDNWKYKSYSCNAEDNGYTDGEGEMGEIEKENVKNAVKNWINHGETCYKLDQGHIFYIYPSDKKIGNMKDYRGEWQDLYVDSKGIHYRIRWYDGGVRRTYLSEDEIKKWKEEQLKSSIEGLDFPINLHRVCSGNDCGDQKDMNDGEMGIEEKDIDTKEAEVAIDTKELKYQDPELKEGVINSVMDNVYETLNEIKQKELNYENHGDNTQIKKEFDHFKDVDGDSDMDVHRKESA